MSAPCVHKRERTEWVNSVCSTPSHITYTRAYTDTGTEHGPSSISFILHRAREPDTQSQPTILRDFRVHVIVEIGHAACIHLALLPSVRVRASVCVPDLLTVYYIYVLYPCEWYGVFFFQL